MFKKAPFHFKMNNWQYYLIQSISPIFCFLAVFLLPKNSFIKTISVSVRYNNPRFIFAIAILLFLTFSIKNIRLSNIATAVVIFPIFGFALNGLWASMYTETNVIAGILPRMDALSFFSSSMSLIENGYFIGYSTERRPLFGGFFAFLLWIFGENFQLAMAAIAFISAAVTYFALIEVRKTLNPIAAIVFFIPQFLFYRHTIGNVMSEALGYILGMTAMSFFLVAFRRQKFKLPHSIFPYFCGIFFFTLAQLTRPGAILTLPLLVLFTGWFIQDENRKYWRVFIYAILTILFAYALNNFLLNRLNFQTPNQFSNALLGLYGVVTGGMGWGNLQTIHPELFSLEPGMRELRMLEVILTELILNPNNFIFGWWYQFSLLFSLRPIDTYSIYSFMLSNNSLVDNLLIFSFLIFSTIGVVHATYRHKSPLYRFILILLIGFFFSLPIAPPDDSQYMRYYAATIPLLGLLPAVGITSVLKPIFNKIKFSKYLEPIFSEELFFAHNSFSFLLVFLIAIAPFLINTHPRNSDWPLKGCPVGESEVILTYYPGTDVSVKPIVKTWAPNISRGDFKLGIHNIPNQVMINSFESVPIPTTLFPSLNSITGKPLYVVFGSNKLPEKKTTYRACGIMDNPQGESIFYPHSMEEFQPIN